MNRHRIWSLSAAALLVLAAGCQPVKRAPQAANRPLQASPNINQPLTAEGTTYNPNAPVVGPLTDGPQAVPVTKVVRVGLLLPLTGRNAELGRAMQDAATVSLFDKYAGMSVKSQGIRLELLPRDTGDTPQQAAQAASQAMAEGASFLIGPLFADATEAASDVAQSKHIGVLSLSNNRAKAEPNVYTFGFSPQEQARRVIAYALAHGRGRIAVLVPDSALGTAVLQAANDAVKPAGLTLVAQVRYSAQGVNLETALNKLVPPGASPNFDALLLPEGGPSLDTLLRGLSTRGVTAPAVQLLGTGIWDDAALLHRSSLTGAWLASSPPTLTAQFEDRFRATYNYIPPRIASLAYDAVALAVTLATSDRPFTQAILTSNAGFNGPANGVFRLRQDGQVQRGLAVLQVNGGSLDVLEPPPSGFKF